jgi:hypothetical protein
MNANKINEQIERLEEELAKLKEEANKPSKYEIEYKAGSTYFIGSYRTTPGNSGKDEDYLNTGRYRSTEKFANEHFKTQTETMRLGALVEAVTIEMNMEDWVADWDDKAQVKYSIYYNPKGGEYCSDYWWTDKTVGILHMSEEVAERVCEVLNNKEYEL